MKSYTVKVTNRDIRLGVVGDYYSCPVALALKRVTRQIYGVGSQNIFKGEMIVGPSFRLPTKVAKFLSLFDKQKPVQPFTFKIKLP
jgi:hypothetical protein